MKNRVDKHMSSYPYFVTEKTSVTEALGILEKNKIRHLPVIEMGEVVGIVSDRDLGRLEAFHQEINALVADVMVRDPYLVRVGTPLSEVARTMAVKKYGSAIVVNENQAVVGIFTTTDGMSLLSRLLDEREPIEEEQGIEYFIGTFNIV